MPLNLFRRGKRSAKKSSKVTGNDLSESGGCPSTSVCTTPVTASSSSGLEVSRHTSPAAAANPTINTVIVPAIPSATSLTHHMSTSTSGSQVVQTRPTKDSPQRPTPVALETAPLAEESQHEVESHEDETETSRSLTDAERRLKDAAEKLDKMIPDDMRISVVENCADVNSLADNIGSAITTLMWQRNIDKSNEHVLKSLTKRWVKKVFPFVQEGLRVGTALILRFLP